MKKKLSNGWESNEATFLLISRMEELNIDWKIKLIEDIWLIMTKFKTILANLGKRLVG